ncbi:MAG: hypothetical protein ACOZNI_28895 [Myxococcota bacterium]
MLRRLARTLLLLVAALGLLPGVSEAAEQVAELVTHGHPAHSAPGEVDPLAGEHGCSPVEHRCPCHESQSLSLNGAYGAGAPAGAWLTWMLDADQARRRARSARRPATAELVAASRATGPPTPPPNA